MWPFLKTFSVTLQNVNAPNLRGSLLVKTRVGQGSKLLADTDWLNVRILTLHACGSQAVDGVTFLAERIRSS